MCAPKLLPARRLFHRDGLARKRPLVGTGTRPQPVLGDGRLLGSFSCRLPARNPGEVGHIHATCRLPSFFRGRHPSVLARHSCGGTELCPTRGSGVHISPQLLHAGEDKVILPAPGALPRRSTKQRGTLVWRKPQLITSRTGHTQTRTRRAGQQSCGRATYSAEG
jgi:hypothetical protein